MKKKLYSYIYFVAPTIFQDSRRQIDYVKTNDNLTIHPKTIDEFVNFLESEKVLYQV